MKAGNLVGRESTLPTTMSQIDPMLFLVGVTEADYLRIAAHRARPHRRPAQPRGYRAHPVRRHEVSADGSRQHSGTCGRSHHGHSGSRAALSQPGRSSVRPVRRVRILLDTKAGRLIPQRAVQELQNLYSVAVVEGDKVAFRNVKVGQRVDSLWVIEKKGSSQENRSSSKAFSAFRTA